MSRPTSTYVDVSLETFDFLSPWIFFKHRHLACRHPPFRPYFHHHLQKPITPPPKREIFPSLSSSFPLGNLSLSRIRPCGVISRNLRVFLMHLKRHLVQQISDYSHWFSK